MTDVADEVQMWAYSKTFGFEGGIVDPDSVTISPALNGAGVLSIVLDPEHQMNDALRAHGARIVVHFRGGHVFSGAVRNPETDFMPTGECTYHARGDFRLLENTLAYVRPAAPIQPTSLDDPGQAWPTGEATTGTAKNQGGYYKWPDGINSAEAAMKHIVQVNCIDRMGRPIEVKPNLDRGGNARAAGQLPDVRFQSVAEVVTELADWSGLVIDMWQEPDGTVIYFDVHVPDEFAQVIDPGQGIIDGGTISQQYPDATRVVVGGPGEDAARAFFLIQDPNGYEDEYGDPIEVFRDATGANLEWPDDLAEDRRVPKYYLLRSDVEAGQKSEFQSYINAAGRDALSDGLPTSSLDVELAEVADLFTFMGENGIALGDWLTAKSKGVTVHERITEADITLSARDGLKVTPFLGKRSDDPDRTLWKALAGINKSVSNIIRKR